MASAESSDGGALWRRQTEVSDDSRSVQGLTDLVTDDRRECQLPEPGHRAPAQNDVISHEL
jgi:hypothetical protein